MRALVFGVDPEPADPSLGTSENHLVRNLALTPMALTEVEEPTPLADDWVVLRPRLTGIRGSGAVRFAHSPNSTTPAPSRSPSTSDHPRHPEDIR